VFVLEIRWGDDDIDSYIELAVLHPADEKRGVDSLIPVRKNSTLESM
jgi:hypothetical protein